MSTQPVRLVDVAQRAGTSTKTASRVLNGDPRVADDTRRRVQDAMNELGYQVDVLARSLRTGVDETIAVVVPTIGDPFFASMIEEIERAAFEGGIKVLVATNSRDPREEQRVIDSLLARRVAGIIVTPFLADYSFLTVVRTPVVFLDRRPEGLDSGAVLVDDRGWAKRATEHLCRHGHQRIAIVADDMRVRTSAYRLEGYRSALREWSLDVDSRLEALDCERADDAYRATLQLLDLAQPPTGIFSARSETTVGVIKALHHQNRTDTALVSFGDVELADLVSPPVTVVDHSARTMARRALDRLRGRMHGDADTPDDEIIDMTLIERGSGEIRPRVATAPAGGGVR